MTPTPAPATAEGLGPGPPGPRTQPSIDSLVGLNLGPGDNNTSPVGQAWDGLHVSGKANATRIISWCS